MNFIEKIAQRINERLERRKYGDKTSEYKKFFHVSGPVDEIYEGKPSLLAKKTDITNLVDKDLIERGHIFSLDREKQERLIKAYRNIASAYLDGRLAPFVTEPTPHLKKCLF